MNQASPCLRVFGQNLLCAAIAVLGICVAAGQTALAQDQNWVEVTLQGEIPGARFGHTLTNVGVVVYLFGGSDGVAGRVGERMPFVGARRGALDDLWQFNEGDEVFNEIAPADNVKPPSRSNHTATAANNKLYVFYGLGSTGLLDDVWCYDPAINLWTQMPTNGPKPEPRAFHSTVTVNNQIYLFAGLGGANGTKLFDDAWRYNPMTNTWTQISSLPNGGRYGMATTVVDDQIVAYGGSTFEGLLRQMLKMCTQDPDAGWTSVDLPPNAYPPSAFGNLFVNPMSQMQNGITSSTTLTGGEAIVDNRFTLLGLTIFLDSISSQTPCIYTTPTDQTARVVSNPFPATLAPVVDTDAFATAPRPDGMVGRAGRGRALFAFGGMTQDGQPSNRAFVLTIDEAMDGPDLTGQWESLIQTCKGAGAKQKCKLRGTFVVANTGALQAGGSTLSLYLSTDDVFDAGDILLKQMAISSVAAGGEVGVAVKKVKLEKGTNGSGKFIIAVLDDGDGVAEIDESNNAIAFGPLP